MASIIRKIKAFLKTPRGFFDPKARHAAYVELPRLEKNADFNNLEIQDKQAWHSAFRNFLLTEPEGINVVEEFYCNPPKLIRKVDFKNSNPILITMQKNDLYRIKKFLDHYRGLGVNQFAIIDNMSDDDSRKNLAEQTDVTLFVAELPYTTDRREAWINRVIAYYGFDRWYIIVDIDELLVYQGMECHQLEEVFSFAKRKKIKRFRSLLLDMYAKEININDKHSEDPYSEYIFFDSDGYRMKACTQMDAVEGGMRARVFKKNQLLTKYPLIFFEKGDVEGKSHFLYPYIRNIDIPCYLALKHYKFLTSDICKYRKIAEDGNFYNGSEEYKQYLKTIDSSNGTIKLLYEGSKEYVSSEDLKSLSVIEAIPW